MSWTSRLRRMTTVWAVATVVTTSATQVEAAGNTSWQWQNPQPQGNTVTAAACPSPTICIANATREVLRTTDSGAHWTAVSFPLQGGATAFSCPSQAACYATGTTGDAAVSNDGGLTWTALATGVSGDFLVAISCPSTTTCFAVGDQGSIVATTDGGATWVFRRNGNAFYLAYSISCPTTTECLLGNRNGLLKTTDGGQTWIVVLNQWTQAVSCPSPLACYAAGNPTYKTTDGGSTWSAESTSGANRQIMVCADETHCLQSGNTPIGDAILLATSDGGASWSTTLHVQYPVNFVIGVGCATGLACIAGGSLGVLFRSTDGGQTWSELDSAVTRNNFAAISCAGDRFCVAVGGSTDAATLFIAVTHDGGSTWTLPRVPVDDSLTAVSCYSTTVCMAVGLNANVVTTTDGGATWRVTNVQTGTNLNMFVGVSCPSKSTCFAATLGGLVFRTDDGGRTWMKRATFGFQFRGLDCPTASVCYVASPQIDQSVIEATYDGGAKWTASALQGVRIWSMSCTDKSHCVGVGTCHSIFYCLGYQAVVTTNAGKTWTGTDAMFDDSPQFVSCGSATSCVAVGSRGQGEAPGNIEVSGDGGFTWSDLPLIDDSLLRGVSCSATRCWAVGDGGAILASV